MSTPKIKKKLKRKIKVVLVLGICVLLGGVGFALWTNTHTELQAFQNRTEFKWKAERSETGYIERIMEQQRNMLAQCQQSNEEFVGIIKIGQLIEEKVVQSSDNEKYLRLDFEQERDGKGTIFVDYRNHMEDQNLILYGHYVYYDETAMFSPLHELKEEENYQNNRIITLMMAEESRQYQIAYVYYYEIGNPEMEYFHVDYGERLEKYIDKIEEVSFYETGIEIEEGDHFLTLQTCVRDHDELRLIVVAKQIN